MRKLYTLIIPVITLFLMNCNQPKTIDIQGHRGCRGLFPENSIEAFKKAIDLGVNTLELDVVISKDDIVVVSHEPYMNPVICLDKDGNEINDSDKLNYNLYQMTFDSIKQFDCGTKPYPRFPEQEKIRTYKPSLDEVIQVSKELNPEIKFNIEIKAEPKLYGFFTPYPEEFVKLVLEVINKNDAFESCNLQSFDLQILEEIKRQSPNMELALLVDMNEDINAKLDELSFKPEILSPYFELLAKESVDEYHKGGFKVIPWTVNTIEAMKKMIDFKVDGIITDYPDILVEILN
jgi:glycerophosphoryl diester phosphodiesterase